MRFGFRACVTAAVVIVVWGMTFANARTLTGRFFCAGDSGRALYVGMGGDPGVIRRNRGVVGRREEDGTYSILEYMAGKRVRY